MYFLRSCEGAIRAADVKIDVDVDETVIKHRHHQAPRWWLAALLAGLATLGPFSVDTYLPAFSGMSSDLNVPMLQMQQTLSVYLAAFAFMFLFHGALSDGFGRKPVILGGLIVFTLASIGCALSRDIGTLIFFRALQGLSCGAGMVVGRAIADLEQSADIKINPIAEAIQYRRMDKEPG